MSYLGKRKMTSYPTARKVSRRRSPLTLQYGVPVTIPAGARGYVRNQGRFGRTARMQRGDSMPEMKYLDTALTWSCDTTGEVTAPCLNIIPQGVGENQRVGRKVVVRSIGIKGLVVPLNTSVDPSLIKIQVILDTQANGTAPTFGGSADSIWESNSIHSWRNPDNAARFKVIKEFDLKPTVTAAYFNSSTTTEKRLTNILRVEWFKKCFIPIEYDSVLTTGALTTVRSNNLLITCINSANDDQYNFTGIARIRYTDA